MATLPAPLAAQGTAKTNQYGNPATVKPAPTKAAIDVRDLQIRLYQFADDSMLGRQVGRVGNKKGTDMIAAEVKRLGLLPAGDNGTYFQTLPYRLRKFTDNSRMTVDGNPLEWNTDFVAMPGQRAPRSIVGAEVVFGGTQGDSTTQISAADAAGKFVVLRPNPNGARGGPGQAFAVRGGGAPARSRFDDAVAIATIDLDALTPTQRVALNEPLVATSSAPGRAAPTGAARGPVDSIALLKAQLAALQPQSTIRLTRDAAARLFKRRNIDGLSAGVKGGTVTASLDFVELPTEWARNVVAVVPGSDPVLKHQYVAIGAHNDHVGITAPVDKDSIRAFNIEKNKLLLANNMQGLGPEILTTIRVNMDSIRKVHPKARLDSINNGADDDGSGSMGVLEIAEAMMAMPVKPKRSTIFIWHTGEEAGLIGSAFFVRNPTVPIDSVVAQLNVDMIGRGRAEDLPSGGPDYVGVVGSFFDSKDLGETVKAVNTKQAKPLTLDYKFDEPIAWSGYNNIYGRSDHFNYAQQGVPIAFFFTGLHGDYHQRSDEPEFIDYPHYAKIANYIKDLVVDVGNGPRPRLNGTKPAKPRVIVP
ncbi:M28 family peptidase [Gemmatimonas sp.]|uniref:M28 family peptidase n=1 Tax=Gemmatimonas sp. TaxID=1962908 RepID=UPI00356B1C67